MGSPFILRIALLLGLMSSGSLSAYAADLGRESIVVLVNRNLPASRMLGQYYAEQRGIAPERICELDLPTAEHMSRRDYESRLRDPLLAFLRSQGHIAQRARNPRAVKPHESAWDTQSSDVSFIVSIHGVPVRIDPTRPAILGKAAAKLGVDWERDEASVDSELATLLLNVPLAGQVSNPLYTRYSRFDGDARSRFILLATRLDGPSPEVVRQMIDHAIQSERYGMLGRAYFDMQGLQSGGYVLGDLWMQQAAERMRSEGFECEVDANGGVFHRLFPMEDAAFYMGWYTGEIDGPFIRPNFTFSPGAFAYHLHSFSAATLRSRSERWVGPLLARGASASAGAVHEPYLQATLDLAVFTDRLCRGYSLAESAYLALPSLSWQMTVVGDPLYRPFRYPLGKQLEHLIEDGHPGVEWIYLRHVNLLVREGRFNVAMDYCREKIAETGSLVLREKLGDLYLKNLLYRAAQQEYEFIVGHSDRPETSIRVGARLTLLLRLLGHESYAEQVESDLRQRWRGSPLLAWLSSGHPSGDFATRLSLRTPFTIPGIEAVEVPGLHSPASDIDEAP